MSKLIAISLNPNIPPNSLWWTIKNFLQSLMPVSTDTVDAFKEVFKKLFSQNEVYVSTFYTGRTAWYAILKGMGIGAGDEVLIPAFTCVAVVNPIRWLGATPVYVDVDDALMMDLQDAGTKVTSSTKVFLLQYTFGYLPDTTRYEEFCRKHDLKLVEDCAHILDPEYLKKGIGLLGDAAFFSFGRDKCITSGTGGIALTKNGQLAAQIALVHDSLPQPTLFDVWRYFVYMIGIEKVYFAHTVHPILGKLVHRILFALGIIQKANSVAEKHGQMEAGVMKQWHPLFAQLALKQIRNLSSFSQHRKALADMYASKLEPAVIDKTTTVLQNDQQHAWLRYSLRVDHPHEVRRYFAKRNIILGDWYDQVIAPKQVDLDAIGYGKGSCPKAENIAQHIINLPTSPRVSLEEATMLIDDLLAYLKG